MIAAVMMVLTIAVTAISFLHFFFGLDEYNSRSLGRWGFVYFIVFVLFLRGEEWHCAARPGIHP